MSHSQNGWPALAGNSSKLHTWTIPANNGTFKIRMRNGSAGFLLALFALWYAETIEKVAGKVLDDWGYAPRPIRGSTVTSNHASGTAMDLNATAHVLGRRGTFKHAWQYVKIRARLRWMRGTVRAGLDYHGRPDEMHYEINKPLKTCERVARRTMRTPRGRRILAANPGQKLVILS